MRYNGVVRATVIVDTQNAYGSSGDALGQRVKPTAEGVVEAFASVGFKVEDVRIAVALPDQRDVQRASSDLAGLRNALSAVAREVGGLKLPPAMQLDQFSFTQHLTAAATTCTQSVTAMGLRDRLLELNTCAVTVQADLDPADHCLRLLVDGLTGEVSRASGPVSGSWVTAMRVLVESVRRLGILRSAVESISSFSYAGGSNLDFRAQLPTAAADVAVSVLEGRFRPGRDGQTPGEKQVDTLCAVACVEATSAAVARGEPYAVIVLSDDDDLTPALAHASGIADGTHVSVIVAGTATVQTRHGRAAPAPTRPGWLVLDASMWCRLVGLEPDSVRALRNQVANLCAGNKGVFTPLGKTAVMKSGLVAKLDRRDEGLAGATAMSVRSLSWGPRSDRPIPGVVVSTRASGLSNISTARARRAKGARVDVRQVPLDLGGSVGEALLGVPGWWMAGDEVIVALVQIQGRPVFRVLGFAPGAVPSEAPAEAVAATVAAIDGVWTEVTDGTGTWTVYADSKVGLSVGDRVAICPYERGGRRGPGGRPMPPRAILLSSRL